MTEPSPSRPTLNIVIACGGTGGHLFPGIAVAQELKKRGHNVTLLISQKKVDAQASKNYGDLNFRTIEAIAMPKIPSMSLLGFGLRLYKAIRFSRSLLDEVNADVVIGMGGFTSFPPVYAAHRKGIRTYVHDSNALPGKPGITSTPPNALSPAPRCARKWWPGRTGMNPGRSSTCPGTAAWPW